MLINPSPIPILFILAEVKDFSKLKPVISSIPEIRVELRYLIPYLRSDMGFCMARCVPHSEPSDKNDNFLKAGEILSKP